MAESSQSGLDRKHFRDPPTEARTRIFWRVFGPAWTPGETDFQFELLKEAGVGGLTVFFMYPVALDDPTRGIHNQKFLAPEFLQTVGYAARRAEQLGLRFSVAGGTGWPFGGPSVAVPDSAQQLRRVILPADTSRDKVWRLPPLKEGEDYLAAFSGARDVTALIHGNTLHIPDGADSAAVQVFIEGPTRMRVKRAALGAEGLVVDHLNRQAVKRYLEGVVAPLVRSGRIDSVFCDSLEVYGANWTKDFPAHFRTRRGYELKPLLPQLFDDRSSLSPDLRFDFWRTQAELAEDEFVRTVSDWSHRHRVKFEMEAYGTPPNPLTAARWIDVPAGEQYEWKGFSLSRLAASGAHLARKRIISAEAWTWLGIPNRLGDSLSDLKLASNLHFLAGINDLVGVDFAYSPRSAGVPGWMPYYGPVLNQNNPQWPWFRHLVDYTSRCQWLLRQGKPVADVAIYLPVEDKFALGPTEQMPLGFHLRDHFVSGEKTDEFGLATALRHHSNLIHNLLTHGFNYDGIDFFSIEQLARIRQGRLRAGDGDYRIVILPNLAGMELEALEKLAEFYRAGGTVIATRRLPERCYGMKSCRRSEQLAALVERMFGAATNRTTAHTYGKGRAFFVPDETNSLVDVLKTLKTDLTLEPYQPEVGFVHRHEGARDIYFLANVGETTRVFEAQFPQTDRSVSLWDAKDGSVRAVQAVEGKDGVTSVPLQLSPRGSISVVLSDDSIQAPSRPAPAEERWVELNIVWNLSFAGVGAPPSRSLHELVSWTSWPEGRFYSGTASYKGLFNWDQALPRQATLVFSQVHEVASVEMNGRSAGPIWTPPYEVDVTSLLRPGTNVLSLSVANLPLNRFLGMPDEDLGPLRAVYGTRFPAPSEKQVARKPAPSGLVGPAKLRISY